MYTSSTTCAYNTTGNSQCCGTATIIVIDASVVNIQGNAFRECDTVIEVDFSSASRLQTIGEKAFSSMDLLSSVDMSGATQLLSIGSGAFTAVLSLLRSSSQVPSHQLKPTRS